MFSILLLFHFLAVRGGRVRESQEKRGKEGRKKRKKEKKTWTSRMTRTTSFSVPVLMPFGGLYHLLNYNIMLLCIF